MKHAVTTFSWHQHCEITLLVDAERYLPSMLEAIEQANHYILLEMYLVKPGKLFNRISIALQQAAIRGVQCYLLFDDFGSKEVSERKLSNLQHPNIQLQRYNPLSSRNPLVSLYRVLWHKLPQDLYRTHRKLLLVDGQLAFTGGTGICDEFSEARFGPWREHMIRFKGKVVEDWQALFCASWPEPLTLMPNHCNSDSSIHCQLAASYAQHQNPLQKCILQMCKNAKRRLWFSTAYFVPPWRLHHQLIKAAKRGVDVRLLLPGSHIDHPSIRHASRRLYARFLRHGIKIYEYQPRFLHAKAVLCDDQVSLGSSNFDRWGMRWNMEANLQIDSSAFAEQICRMLEEDFSHSVSYDYHRWCQRSWRLRMQEAFWGWMDHIVAKYINRLR